jgi:hypothetical protein
LRCRGNSTAKFDPPRPHGLGNVLQGLRPKVIPTDLDLAANLPISVIGYTYAARLSDTLQPSRNVDAIAKDIVVVDNDIADMNADPVLNSDILRDVRVLRGHGTLDFDRAAGGIDRAAKFYQQAVTSGLDDAASMGSDSRVNNGFSGGLEPSQGAFLVTAHEAAVSSNIRSQHRRQSPLYPLACQWCPQVAVPRHIKAWQLIRGLGSMSALGQNRKNSR